MGLPCFYLIEVQNICIVEGLVCQLTIQLILFCIILYKASQSSVGRKVTAQKYWAVSDQVNRSLLSQTVQHFCGQFPVYRLHEVHFKSSAGIGNRSRRGQIHFSMKKGQSLGLIVNTERSILIVLGS